MDFFFVPMIDDRPSHNPLCIMCRHFRASDPVPSCAAFDVIPDRIWRDCEAHVIPIEGDNGIRFEMKDDL